MTVKSPLLIAVPPGVITVTLPPVVPTGTDAVMRVAESTVNAALIPLNFTAVVPRNPEPLITTDVPMGPEGGEKPDSGGRGREQAIINVLLLTEVAPTK